MRVFVTLFRPWEIPPLQAALGRLGHRTEFRPLLEISKNPSLIPPQSALVVDMRVEPAVGLHIIHSLRRKYGYGPGILALVDGKSANSISAMDAGADSCLNGDISTDMLTAAILGLGRLTGALPPLASSQSPAPVFL